MEKQFTHTNRSPRVFGKVGWSATYNYEYCKSQLSKVIILYSVTINEDNASGALVRVTIGKEGHSLIIGLMHSISEEQFESKKRNNIAKIKDLFKYLCTLLSTELPMEIEHHLLKDYYNSIKSLKC